jgi:CheY-like chemotaxis protein
VQRLAEKLGADRDSDIMILDVFAALQDNLSLEKINMALLSCRAHIRNYAKTKLTEIGKKCVPMLLENLRMEDPDLLIHTLNVLALIGDISAVAPVRKLLFNEPADPNVRFAAYEALGMLPIEKGVHALAGGLLDPVENVRAAAAKAIDRNYSHTLSAGIRNIIKNSASDFHSIVKVIVDSESDNIFKDMLDNDTFKKYALSYIANKAHKDVREHYGKFFKAAGDQAAADAILRTAAPKETKEQAPKHKCPFRRVYIVDDSKMILSVYKNVLHEMSCDPELFDTPRAVIERIAKQAPDLLVTDLSMPDMTGIELTAAVRKQYPPKDLPIIMVTTQHETQDNEAAYSAGVDIVMHKPFTADSLAQAFDSVSQKWKR